MAELKKVNTGEDVRMKAGDWNAMIDAARDYQGRRGDMKETVGYGFPPSGVVVKVRNDTDADLPQSAVRVLDDLLITPDDNLVEFRGQYPVFSVAAITSQNKSKAPAVLLQPLLKTKIGKALVSGATPVKIKVNSANDEYAVLDETDDVVSASSGIFRILWKQTGTGTGKWALLQFPAGAGGSGGYFKVVNTSDTETQKVSIVDGYDNDAANCGIALIGNSQQNISKAELTVTETGYVILETTYDEENNTINPAELKFITTAVFYEAGKSIVLIARVFVADSKITKIIQEHYGMIESDIRDEC